MTEKLFTGTLNHNQNKKQTFSKDLFLFVLDSCPLYVQFVETLIFTCINSEEGERRKRLVELVILALLMI